MSYGKIRTVMKFLFFMMMYLSYLISLIKKVIFIV